jgi:hypothetical protein
MFKLIASGVAFLLCLGTAGLMVSNSSPRPAAEVQFAADAAFRDGLYLGRLAAQDGRPERPSTGRWSSQQDRASFTAGYQRGYNDVLARALKQ